MPKFTYGGDVTQTYPQYLDTAKGSTLVAAPGETYDIAQVAETVADGEGGSEPLQLPMPPDERWTSAKSAKKTEASKENG